MLIVFMAVAVILLLLIIIVLRARMRMRVCVVIFVAVTVVPLIILILLLVVVLSMGMRMRERERESCCATDVSEDERGGVHHVTRKESYCLKHLRLSSLGGAHVEIHVTRKISIIRGRPVRSDLREVLTKRRNVRRED